MNKKKVSAVDENDILKLLKKLEQLALDARIQQDIFFEKYLNGFKKSQKGGE